MEAAKLAIYDSYCQILNETDSVILTALDKELSYFNKNAIFSRMFKIKKWDGFSHLLNGDLTFPSGLFSRVCNFYKDRNVILEIIDNRTIISDIHSINILPRLEKLGKIPFDYQLEMVEITKLNRRGILRSATGSGKSITIALIAAYFGKPTNVYVIGTDLLYQMHSLFSQLFDEEIGIIGDGLCKIKRINIVSIWTVGVALGLKANEILTEEDEEKEESTLSNQKFEDIKNMLANSKVNIYDECHSCSCVTIQTINKYIKSEHTYGLSASPHRDDGSDLLIESLLGKTIFNLSAVH
jgi:superfamily II DNA or RNA helicase